MKLRSSLFILLFATQLLQAEDTAPPCGFREEVALDVSCEEPLVIVKFFSAIDILCWQPVIINNYSVSRFNSVPASLNLVGDPNSTGDWQAGVRFQLGFVNQENQRMGLFSYTGWGFRGSYYRTFDFLFGKRFAFCSQQAVTPFFGLTDLLLLRSYGWFTYSPTGDVEHSSTLNGLGGIIGAEWRYAVTPSLSLFSRFAFSLAYGQQNSIYDQHFYASSGINSFKDEISRESSLYGMQFSAGVNYTFRAFGVLQTLSLGYEIIDWLNIPTLARYQYDGPSGGRSHSITHSSFCLQGFTVRFGSSNY